MKLILLILRELLRRIYHYCYTHNNGHTITQDFSVTIEPKDPVVNIAEIPRQTFKKGETISVKVNYDFDGEADKQDFSYMVYTNMVIDPNVRISNVNIDKDEQVISFNLTGIGVGSSYVNVYVFNNGTSAIPKYLRQK